MELNKHQIKHLKALAHPRKPIVRIGQNGLTEAVLKELDLALDHHELVKIKIAGEREERTTIVEAVCTRLQTQCVALTGGVAVLFRANPDNKSKKTRIDLSSIK